MASPPLSARQLIAVMLVVVPVSRTVVPVSRRSQHLCAQHHGLPSVLGLPWGWGGARGAWFHVRKAMEAVKIGVVILGRGGKNGSDGVTALE